MKGTVTFPRHLFFPRCTIPFSKVIPGYSNGNLGFAHPYSGIVIPVLGAYDSGWWSFYVLYMDKNRPLPQGDTFDPYREKDFLRRKAEGFPKPIYPNTILVTDAYMGWKKQFVFKLFAPENVEYIVLPDDTVLTDCFLCDSNTAEVKYIK